MQKNPLPYQEMVLKRLFFKIYRGSIPRTPVEVQIHVRPPPKFLNPYAYGHILLKTILELSNTAAYLNYC